MIKKGLNIILILLIVIGLFPIRPISSLIPDEKFDIVITGQEMGCPCPEFKVIGGDLLIPDSIKQKYQNLFSDEINLTSNSLFKRYNYEIAHQEIFVRGKVVSAELISDNEFAPVFNVEAWKIKSYIPILWTFSKNGFVIYSILIISGLIYFLILFSVLIIKRLRRKTAYNTQ